MSTMAATALVYSRRLASQRVSASLRSCGSRGHPGTSAISSRSISSSSPSLSSSSSPRLFRDAVVAVRGESAYASSREYVLLPPHTTLDMVADDDSLVIASLRAHRNILFGAKVHDNNNNNNKNEKSKAYTVADVCPPLVHVALEDAGHNGEQPQAMSTLHGLCEWVQNHVLPLLSVIEETENAAAAPEDESALPPQPVDDEQDRAAALQQLVQKWTNVEQEAVRAIATGIPRPGHSVVGIGTFRDGEAAWKQAARVFAASSLSPECRLYQEADGQLIQIEHLADTKPAYLKSAGGAMARFVFM